MSRRSACGACVFNICTYIESSRGEILSDRTKKWPERLEYSPFRPDFYVRLVVSSGSDDALTHHGVGHLHESGDVGALHVVDVSVGLGAVLDALGVDVAHYLVQAAVNLLGAPLQVLGVLAHLEARGGHSAGVHGLAGSVCGL